MWPCFLCGGLIASQGQDVRAGLVCENLLLFLVFLFLIIKILDLDMPDFISPV